jgi:hypothetical protein
MFIVTVINRYNGMVHHSNHVLPGEAIEAFRKCLAEYPFDIVSMVCVPYEDKNEA